MVTIGGSLTGGCQIIVRAPGLTVTPSTAQLSLLIGNCCEIANGSWTATQIYIAEPSFTPPFPTGNPFPASTLNPEQVTLFTYVSNSLPPSPIWNCSPCPFTLPGTPTNQPLPAGQQFTLSLS